MALRPAEQYIYDSIAENGNMAEIEEAVALIIDYRVTAFHPVKDELIASWEIDYQGIYDFIISVFTATLTNYQLTYQAMVGMLNHKIKLHDELDRIKIVADLIGLISLTGLIDIDSEIGEYHQISTDYEMKDIPTIDRHITVTLRPQPVDSNFDKYGTGSVLLGDSMNHHDGYLRLSHLEKMGQIPLKLNKDFINAYEETPKEPTETFEEQIQWEAFQEESTRKYDELMDSDSKFYDQGKYDVRGRSYTCSYYLSLQGSPYKKAAIGLYNEEIVGGF